MRGSRISRAAILEQLRHAARTGDRAALTLAMDQMKVWALSPRYWERYLDLLSHPLARLVDLAVIKQGERIARQKGWAKRKRAPASPPARDVARRRAVRATPAGRAVQRSLFPE
jgi:phosphoribosyl-dephospho-CoA transferase